MKSLLFVCIVFFILTVHNTVASAKNSEFEFVADGESYQYSVIQAGDNYNFKFNISQIDEAIKRKAAHHVLRSVY